MSYDIGYLTKCGDKAINEDAICVFEKDDTLVCILADGLGGFDSGEVASKFVVESIHKSLLNKFEFSEEYLAGVIEKAHEELINEQNANPLNKKMCSTIVVLLVNDDAAVFAYVGDSRLYMFSNKHIVFTTKDHSVCQLFVNAGELEYEKIRFHEDKNRITRALGQSESFSVECGHLQLNPDTDSFLLCSDGVWENLDSLQLEFEYCKSHAISDWLRNIETRILLQASKSMDNYSLIGLKTQKGE